MSDSESNPSDLPARVLAEVRKSVRATSRRTTASPAATEPQYTGPGPSQRDPQTFATGIADLVSHRGWQRSNSVGLVTARWPELVGTAIAQHARPGKYIEESGTLEIVADSTLWATQISMMIPQLLNRLDEEVGNGVIAELRIRTR